MVGGTLNIRGSGLELRVETRHSRHIYDNEYCNMTLLTYCMVEDFNMYITVLT